MSKKLSVTFFFYFSSRNRCLVELSSLAPGKLPSKSHILSKSYVQKSAHFVVAVKIDIPPVKMDVPPECKIGAIVNVKASHINNEKAQRILGRDYDQVWVFGKVVEAKLGVHGKNIRKTWRLGVR
jgi:hypothetical protein